MKDGFIFGQLGDREIALEFLVERDGGFVGFVLLVFVRAGARSEQGEKTGRNRVAIADEKR